MNLHLFICQILCVYSIKAFCKEKYNFHSGSLDWFSFINRTMELYWLAHAIKIMYLLNFFMDFIPDRLLLFALYSLSQYHYLNAATDNRPFNKVMSIKMGATDRHLRFVFTYYRPHVHCKTQFCCSTHALEIKSLKCIHALSPEIRENSKKNEIYHVLLKCSFQPSNSKCIHFMFACILHSRIFVFVLHNFKYYWIIFIPK